MEKTIEEAPLTKKTCVVLPLLLAALLFAQPLLAGRRSGTVKGRISDNRGFALPGATVYAISPAQLGIRRFITPASGQYGFPELPPGTYKIMVEMPGFKTINVEGIVLAAGTTAVVDFTMEPSEIEEEVTRREPPARLDKETARLAAVLDTDILARIPMPRDFSAVLGLAPGAVFLKDDPGFLVSIEGGPATDNSFIDEGVNVTDPVSHGSLARMNVDLIDEVVIESAAVPVTRAPGQGAYINVIHRTGGNSFDGSLFLAYTGKGLTKGLWSTQDLADMNLAEPPIDRSDLDASFTAGGPFVPDVAWFFTNVRFRPVSRTTPFKGVTDPLDFVNAPYNFKDTDLTGTFRLSARVLSKYQGTAEASYSSIREPVYASDIAWNRPESTTHSLESGSLFRARANLIYTMDQSSFADLSLNYVTSNQPLLLNSGASAEPSYHDIGTGYYFGSGPYNDREKRKRVLANATLTRLQDRLLGTSHEFVAGADYEAASANSSVWKTDNLIMNYLNGSPYTFGLVESPVSGETVGEGLIGFSVVPLTEGAMNVQRELRRLGFFVQDSLQIAGRAALSLGFRFDHTDTRFLSLSKGVSGNEISVNLGTSLIYSLYGVNPFGSASIIEWSSVISWNSVSPRFGLSVDLLGTGRTLLKASYARIPESQELGYTVSLDPFPPGRFHDFLWFDENNDGLVSSTDIFTLVPDNFNLYKTEFYTQRVDSKLAAPMVDEWTAGLEQELTSDFSLSLRYVSRSEKGLIGDVMYDPETGRPWYNAQDSPAGWWVPFSTVVPAAAGYPETPVTVYLRSTSAPGFFDRIQEVPELVRRYRGVEFSFRKRMSHNWQLFGSVVWSRSTGTSSPYSPLSAGMSVPVLTPNSWINISSGSRTDFDRPLAIRLMGTVSLPYQIYLSAYYRFLSGDPWARTVTIIPPASWAEANGAYTTPVTVFLESPGARRHSSWQDTDLRLEKEFVKGGKAVFSVSLDVLNVLGNRYRLIDYNDGGLWSPEGEGSDIGERIVSGTYGRAVAVSGTRTFRFNLRLGF
jgi:hypothetical protein